MRSGSDLRTDGEDNRVTSARRHIDLFATQTSHLASGVCDVPELKAVVNGAYCRVYRSNAKRIRAEIRTLADQDSFSTNNFGEPQ